MLLRFESCNLVLDIQAELLVLLDIEGGFLDVENELSGLKFGVHVIELVFGDLVEGQLVEVAEEPRLVAEAGPVPAELVPARNGSAKVDITAGRVNWVAAQVRAAKSQAAGR